MSDYFDEDLDAAFDRALDTLLRTTPVEYDYDPEAADCGLSLLDLYADRDITPREAMSHDAWARLQREWVAFVDHHEGAIRRAMRTRDHLPTCIGIHDGPYVDCAPAYDLDDVAHDWVLTRNRHGVGFWDRGLGIAGELLTRGAHFDGEVDAYVGDDGLVYVM